MFWELLPVSQVKSSVGLLRRKMRRWSSPGPAVWARCAVPYWARSATTLSTTPYARLLSVVIQMRSRSSWGAVTPVHRLRVPGPGMHLEKAIRGPGTRLERSLAGHNPSAATFLKRKLQRQRLRVDLIAQVVINTSVYHKGARTCYINLVYSNLARASFKMLLETFNW